MRKEDAWPYIIYEEVLPDLKRWFREVFKPDIEKSFMEALMEDFNESLCEPK